jgi:hypothetical protein
MPKTPASTSMPNSSAERAARMVDAMKRYQDLGHDIELLRDHLASPVRETFAAARIAACMLSAATLTQALTRMLILELSEQEAR